MLLGTEGFGLLDLGHELGLEGLFLAHLAPLAHLGPLELHLAAQLLQLVLLHLPPTDNYESGCFHFVGFAFVQGRGNHLAHSVSVQYVVDLCDPGGARTFDYAAEWQLPIPDWRLYEFAQCCLHIIG